MKTTIKTKHLILAVFITLTATFVLGWVLGRRNGIDGYNATIKSPTGTFVYYSVGQPK